jgi:hypothetical protein
MIYLIIWLLINEWLRTSKSWNGCKLSESTSSVIGCADYGNSDRVTNKIVSLCSEVWTGSILGKVIQANFGSMDISTNCISGFSYLLSCYV